MNYILRFLLSLLIVFISSCSQPKTTDRQENHEIMVRHAIDSIGFAIHDWQMDSIIVRIRNLQADSLKEFYNPGEKPWKACIVPHDDYSYVGYQYLNILAGIKAKTIILFGVAHKARKFNLEDKLIFDRFDYWQGPYGKTRVSGLRDKIMDKLDESLCEVHDSMQIVEHSLEALLPFLQYFNPEVEIVPILVPYMSYDRMKEISESLANGIFNILEENDLKLGRDVAIVITTDAVHYGDESWGGKNYAPYGTDDKGTSDAVNYEHEIIRNCLAGELSLTKIKKFTEYTVQKEDHREYKWTWCGRYSVPLGLMTSLSLTKLTGEVPLQGEFIGYSNSIDHAPIKVDDLGMGTTAPAYNRHWVGYASVGYK